MLLEFGQYRVEAEFRMIDKDQLARMARDDLTAQFGPDRAARAGNEHDLRRNRFAEQLFIGWNRVAPQQLLHLHLAQVADRHLPVHDIGDARQRANLQGIRL